VLRERSDQDHRKVFVTLGKPGRVLVREVAPSVDACYRELEKALGAELMSSLLAVLDRLLNLPFNFTERRARRQRRFGNSKITPIADKPTWLLK
jgi:hypothetical protein